MGQTVKIRNKTNGIKPCPLYRIRLRNDLIFVSDLWSGCLRDTGVSLSLLYERLVGSALCYLVSADGHLLDTLTPSNIILACLGVSDLHHVGICEFDICWSQIKVNRNLRSGNERRGLI